MRLKGNLVPFYISPMRLPILKLTFRSLNPPSLRRCHRHKNGVTQHSLCFSQHFPRLLIFQHTKIIENQFFHLIFYYLRVFYVNFSFVTHSSMYFSSANNQLTNIYIYVFLNISVCMKFQFYFRMSIKLSQLCAIFKKVFLKRLLCYI